MTNDAPVPANRPFSSSAAGGIQARRSKFLAREVRSASHCPASPNHQNSHKKSAGFRIHSHSLRINHELASERVSGLVAGDAKT
jgi:hypothetical protein